MSACAHRRSTCAPWAPAGGSIAFVPALTKALRVGPESAGAVPGPACYMKGGEAPTVCDANVVLGYSALGRAARR
jgi:N-methylhydantoinase A/oxoprolinase/acetone carboxylase beta subunit